jgi:hypothetical protein
MIENLIFKSIYEQIYVDFGLGWGPHIFYWPGLHFISLRPCMEAYICSLICPAILVIR